MSIGTNLLGLLLPDRNVEYARQSQVDATLMRGHAGVIHFAWTVFGHTMLFLGAVEALKFIVTMVLAISMSQVVGELQFVERHQVVPILFFLVLFRFVLASVGAAATISIKSRVLSQFNAELRLTRWEKADADYLNRILGRDVLVALEALPELFRPVYFAMSMSIGALLLWWVMRWTPHSTGVTMRQKLSNV